MCVVSMIIDHTLDKWTQPDPMWPPLNPPMIPTPYWPLPAPATKEDVEALRKEVLDLKELIKKAIAYDKKNNEPHCEDKEKLDKLRKIANIVDINFDDIFLGV